MTLEELYAEIGGDFEQAKRVLRVEKLIDKHIRKLEGNGVVAEVIAAGETMDATRLFESAHAMKGVCANLGLVELAEAASDIAEEYRPGNARSLTDEEVAARIGAISERYERTLGGIRRYVEAQVN